MTNHTSTPHHLRKASTCKNLILPFGDYTPVEVFAMITSNAFKKATEQIRALLAEGKEAEANELKRAQYAYTPSSVWFPTRRESNIKSITGNIIIECDHLTPKEVEHVAYFTYTDVFAMMGFVTSSGNGFKWIVPTNATTIEEHRLAYRQLCDYYSAIFGEGIKGKLDTKQPDPVRLMFLSCDQSNCAFFKTNYREYIIAREAKQSTSDDPSLRGGTTKQSPNATQRLLHSTHNPPFVRNDGSSNDETSSPVEIATQMIREAIDGTKHNTLLRASILMGGYIAGGTLNESDAISLLESEISKREILDFKSAAKTIRDGIAYGKKKPIINQ